MLIPQSFFGTLQDVKNKCRKLNTQLKRGHSLEECLASDSLMDSDEYQESYFWLDKAWSMAGQKEHFILSEFGQTVMTDPRLSVEEKNKIVDDNLSYLSTTPWGTIIINAPQALAWVAYLPSILGYRKKGCEAVLKGFAQYYPLFQQQGCRFYDGGNSPVNIDQTLLLVVKAYASLGTEQEKELVEMAGHKDMTKTYDWILEKIVRTPHNH